MRQTALLTILAQIGCKVPALEFSLSPVDRVFTRIGASDNIFEKESTFFVELSETRVILNHATTNSLVLIDELGRGTTTFDGCAIAYAVAKFLTSRGCRTIFSTHYHELTSEFVARHDMKIYHMGVMEEEDDLVFMYTVSAGPCSKSHGFNAARMAGIPQDIIDGGLKVAEKFEAEQCNLMKLAEVLLEA
jgi:DNA mismatch repair protein MSH6